MCPKGWVVFENLCYFISNHRLNWYDAKKFCESRSARLLTIDTRTMVDFSYEFFEKFYLREHFIVGAHANGFPKKWIWINGYKIPSRGPWYLLYFEKKSLKLNLIYFKIGGLSVITDGVIMTTILPIKIVLF